MNTHDKLELPPLPPHPPVAHMGGRHMQADCQFPVLYKWAKAYAISAIEADRKRIATALESRFIVADSKANVSHPDYQYYVGAADAYDIAEQIVKGDLDE